MYHQHAFQQSTFWCCIFRHLELHTSSTGVWCLRCDSKEMEFEVALHAEQAQHTLQIKAHILCNICSINSEFNKKKLSTYYFSFAWTITQQ